MQQISALTVAPINFSIIINSIKIHRLKAHYFAYKSSKKDILIVAQNEHDVWLRVRGSTTSK